MFYSIILNVILIALLCFTIKYLYKFSKIILMTEEMLENALEVFQETEQSIGELSKLEMFFDSPEIRISIQRVVDNIKLSKVEFSKVIVNFTNYSKQKYITTVEEYDEDNNNQAN